MINQIQYNFDEVIDRRNTHAEKYDALKRFYGTDDVEPFWVADMDLASPNFLNNNSLITVSRMASPKNSSLSLLCLLSKLLWIKAK